MSIATLTCAESRASLVQLLATPRGRHGPREEWLSNWNFPPPAAWAQALHVARERARAGCGGEDDAADAEGALLDQAHNLRLFASPCVTQCGAARRVSAEQLRRCVCRACNTSAMRQSWESLLSSCAPRAPGGELRRALLPLCLQVTPLQPPPPSGAASSSSGAAVSCEPPHDATEFEGAPAGWEDAVASDASRCVTAFNESCCPRSATEGKTGGQGQGQGQVCGGASRGVCEPIPSWLAASWPARTSPLGTSPGTCAWPRTYAAARCRCVGRYAGSACGGCARGWMGAACEEPRPREVRRPLASLHESERRDFFGALAAAATTTEWKALESSHELGVSFYHETSHLLPSHHRMRSKVVPSAMGPHPLRRSSVMALGPHPQTRPPPHTLPKDSLCTRHHAHRHHAYFEAMMELVRRSTGRYTLALPQYLPLQPSDLKLLHTLHPRCVNCLTHPPANWSVAQVASQLREAALQGRQPASERVGRLFEARGVDGAALVALPGRRGLQKLGVDADDARQLLPWLRRVQSSNPKVWGYGVHCCARWLSNMPGKREWLDALRLPELGPVRGKMATVHRLSTNAPGRRWLEAFKALHQVHQWFHVVLGPCTALCYNLPRCDSNHCELLLPLHAAYDMLQRAWYAAHPHQPPCVADDEADWRLDECLPYVTPLRATRAECAGAAAYEYEGIEAAWVQPIRQLASGAPQPQP